MTLFGLLVLVAPEAFETPAPTPHATQTTRPYQEFEEYTTTCSQVHCTSHAGNVLIHHGTPGMPEDQGTKHVCAHELHVKGKCGCECYDESVGVWEEILSETGLSYVHQSSASKCPLVKHGACWYLGLLGDSCRMTCDRRSRNYMSGIYPPASDPILPYILGREPTLKHSPWAVHECYQ